MAALPLVEAGQRVLMVERGGWVPRDPGCWTGAGAFVRTPFYAADARYEVLGGPRPEAQSLCTCVGGASVFYGGASFRLRERDFGDAAEIVGGTGARWPVDYRSLEPHYAQAERLLGVAGAAGEDPTEPHRSTPFPFPPAPLAATSRTIADAARSMGLRPFRIPMAINTAPDAGAVCAQCTTCDAFACAIGAKNDIATRIIPALVARGMVLLSDTVVTRLCAGRVRVDSIDAVHKPSGERLTLQGERFVLAAGALATPHLLLASGLERLNPAGDSVGRYLMRHCNAMTYGLFVRPPNPADEHHKQLAFTDFYFGAEEAGAPAGTLGSLQQVMGPHPGLIDHVLPPALRWLGKSAELLVGRLTGLLSIAEDQPRQENRVRADPASRDDLGLPKMIVEHRYSPRDLAARAFLVRKARQILRKAGAVGCVTWKVSTFSHAVGTVRMGDDARTAPLDSACRYRGLDNLYVTDGSVFPRSAGVNPSLTIAANALRVGRIMAAAAAAPQPAAAQRQGAE